MRIVAVCQFYLPDALGSIRNITNTAGAITFSQRFDPWGNILEQTGFSQSPFGYTGQQSDPSGLIYLRARYYAPAQGRFITQDPFAGLMSTPLTLNPYPYALDNPILHTDPSGEMVPLLAIAGIGFAVGSLYNAYQQTNGFRDFCKFDVLEMVAWGAGSAMAATAATLLVVSGISYAGLGVQGIALWLSGFAATSSIASSLWITGTATVGASATAMAWLFSSPSSIDKVNKTLLNLANKAKNNIGPGRGSAYGTRVHSEFQSLVDSLENKSIQTEVSCLNGALVRHGTPGSIRIDVVYGNLNNPSAFFDLKTGSARLTNARILELRAKAPIGNYPIIEIKP